MDKTKDYTKRIDEIDANNTLVGIASPYASGASAVWLIYKVIVVGTVTSVIYASGTNLFDKIWDNRAAYTYF